MQLLASVCEACNLIRYVGLSFSTGELALMDSMGSRYRCSLGDDYSHLHPKTFECATFDRA